VSVGALAVGVARMIAGQSTTFGGRVVEGIDTIFNACDLKPSALRYIRAPTWA
jgi:hypothetical protein